MQKHRFLSSSPAPPLVPTSTAPPPPYTTGSPGNPHTPFRPLPGRQGRQAAEVAGNASLLWGGHAQASGPLPSCQGPPGPHPTQPSRFPRALRPLPLGINRKGHQAAAVQGRQDIPEQEMGLRWEGLSRSGEQAPRQGTSTPSLPGDPPEPKLCSGQLAGPQSFLRRPPSAPTFRKYCFPCCQGREKWRPWQGGA